MCGDQTEEEEEEEGEACLNEREDYDTSSGGGRAPL